MNQDFNNSNSQFLDIDENFENQQEIRLLEKAIERINLSENDQIEEFKNHNSFYNHSHNSHSRENKRLTPKCHCHYHHRKVFVEKKAEGKYDHHTVCGEDCPAKKFTDTTLQKEYKYEEWNKKLEDVISKIAESQTVHLSMVQLALRLYMHALTGHVIDLTPTQLRLIYSNFKQLLSSFTRKDVVMNLLQRFIDDLDCVKALLIRCWIRSHILNLNYEAIEIITLLINEHTLSPKEACFAYFTRARLQHLYFGNVMFALNDYNKAIENYGMFSDLYNNRGNLIADHFNDPDNALKDYNKAIEIDPSFYLAYDNRGELLEEEYSDLMGAFSDYTMALKCNPSYLIAHQNLANLQFRINKCNAMGNL